MTTPNFASKTLWTGDNLHVLRGLNSETVDLIYLDPPFNSNRTYEAPIGSQAAGAAFKDTWTLSDLDIAWMGLVAEQNPAVAALLDASGKTHGKSMQSYITMMAVRLLEMRRVLKPTGSIYLHCDPTASHYLKMLMDAVFGAALFKAEINWQRTSAHNDSRTFGNVSDRLLFYGTTPINADAIRIPLNPGYVRSHYRYTDKRGRYRDDNLTGPSHGATPGSPGTQPWRGYDPMTINRIWSVPRSGSYATWVANNIIPGYLAMESISERLDALEEANMLIHTANGLVPQLKRYMAASPGQVPSNNWTDIPPINSQAKERIGYPTQKPLALLERIIAASSNPGDLVLDPFCGCATACVAADRLERQWVGIDISPKAADLVKDRLRLPPPLGIGSLFHYGYVTERTDVPQRTDIQIPINYRQNKHVLYGQQEGCCNGCRAHFEYRHLEVDHIVPRSRGGTEHIENLQLLCASCNRIKGNRDQAYLMAQLQSRGLIHE